MDTRLVNFNLSLVLLVSLKRLIMLVSVYSIFTSMEPKSFSSGLITWCGILLVDQLVPLSFLACNSLLFGSNDTC